ncbi:probable inactive receptor kinase At5g58300 [Amaranthus tricolor]|uniref:probable inactive receptor kinase At5g58300 n=1 Tax=Amaranthus tricolor TaxID=29722 RepID=UPI0025911194|nr:probable inactive receptor kinase At5g58300 [Amaranthus tricolor]XP_057520266.1 probable inactive receptor kinase At5g58300 [Amaranthus tricolor]XP_057520267.1 probable inactive receptor kinase At5g58300 [Amaranthus tricolor]
MKLQSSLQLTLILLLLISTLHLTFADLKSDRQALLDFVANVPHSRNLNWNVGSSVCTSWAGVTCNSEGTRVIALHLPGIGLFGPIPGGTIGKLDALQVLSLRSNSLNGKIPSDIASLPSLRSLFLQSNNFSGSIPESLSASLMVLDLSSNSLNGSIPSSINYLTRLIVLNLQDNMLSGSMPNLESRKLKLLNMSYNNLSGKIPNSLQKFPTSSFLGNPLCGPPLDSCSSSSPSPSADTMMSPAMIPIISKGGRSRKLSIGAIVAIVIAGSAVVVLAVMMFLLCCVKRNGVEDSSAVKGKESNIKKAKNQMPKEDFGSGVQTAEKNKLVFFGGCAYNFDLEDLLRASAEVLGKGSYGTAYKAILDEGIVVVVKRLKEVGIGKREFEQQMEMVSNVGQHPNLVPLRAYYFSKDEKLLVYDFMPGGSLSAVLHGNGYNGKTLLDWNARVTIALGAARGILHIHSEGGGKFIHGNIKSSNVLLSQDLEGCISDFGLPLMMNFQGITSRSIGYHAPEVIETRKASQSSDVYSFGVLLLEILTGKAPLKTAHGHIDVVDLPRWVQSVVREEWTSEVFDAELLKSPNAEEEMVHMLQVALACVARVPDMRPRMDEVVRMIEEIRPSESDGRPSSDENKSKNSNVGTPTP